jgi:hypothetical protein
MHMGAANPNEELSSFLTPAVDPIRSHVHSKDPLLQPAILEHRGFSVSGFGLIA